VFAVGQNLGGQLGDGTRITRLTPVKTLISGVRTGIRSGRFAAGESHGLFHTKDDQVWGTGANFIGQLGSDQMEVTHTPTKLLEGIPARSRVIAGGDGSCYINSTKQVQSNPLYCMGNNQDGQLGLDLEATPSTSTPLLSFRSNTKRAYIGETHSILTTDGITGSFTFRSSGTGSSGELGTGGTTYSTEFGVPDVPDTTVTSTSITTTTTTFTSSTVTTVTTTTTVTDGKGPLAAAGGLTPGTIFLIATGVGVVVLGGTLIARPRATDTEDTEAENDFGEMQLARAAQTSV